MDMQVAMLYGPEDVRFETVAYRSRGQARLWYASWSP